MLAPGRDYYDAGTTENLPSRLARVKTNADVVDFVRQFGLLEVGIFERRGSVIPADQFEPFNGPGPSDQEERQPLRALLEDASSTRLTMEVARAMRWLGKPRSSGGYSLSQAAAEIRPLFPKFPRRIRDDDRMLLEAAADSVAKMVNEELECAPLQLLLILSGRGACPSFRTAPAYKSLRGVCYMQLATHLSEGAMFTSCEACSTPFVVMDPRQRFCTATCANRERVRRHRARSGA